MQMKEIMKNFLTLSLLCCSSGIFAQQITQISAYQHNPNYYLAYAQNRIISCEFPDLKFIDITNPSTPTVSASVATTIFPFAAEVSGNYVYVGGGMTYFFEIVDITNINAPVKVGSTTNINGTIYQMAIKGNYAYAPVGADTMYVIDVSVKSNPVVAKKLDLGSFLDGITINGNYAYVSTQSGLKIIDITNPLNPSVLGTYGTVDYGKICPDLINNRIFVETTTGFEVINVSNPTNLSQIFTGGNATGGRISYFNGHIFQVANSVSAYRVTSNSSVYLCNFTGSGQVMDVYALDSMIFLSTLNYVYVLQFSSFGGIGINNDVNKEEIKVYPVPATNYIELNLDYSQDNVLINVFNSVGEKIVNFKTKDQKMKLDVSKFNPGIYYLYINGEKTRFIKFVKE